MLGQEGSFTLRGLANYVHKLTVDNGVIIDHVADLGNPDAGGVPEWRYNFDLTYAGGPIKFGLYYRYIAGGRFGIPPASFPTLASQQKFGSRQYVDASVAYKLTGNVELYGKVDNIFNIAPPIVPNSITQPTVANAQMYDKIGRYFVGGVRVTF
jgi:outer membrane receptor protein involved in Fe transport